MFGGSSKNKSDQQDTFYAHYYRSFVGKSFRDITRIKAASCDGDAGPSDRAEVDSPVSYGGTSMYHTNFLKSIHRIAAVSDSERTSVVERICDVKCIAPPSQFEGITAGEPVGLAILCREQGTPTAAASGRPSPQAVASLRYHVVIQLFQESSDRSESAIDFLGISPSVETASNISDGCSPHSHSAFLPLPRVVIRLAQDTTPATRLCYVGQGILLLLTTGSAAKVEYVDVCQDPPAVHRVRLADQCEILSATGSLHRRVTPHGSEHRQVLVSCLSKRSHFCITFERTMNHGSTPRYPGAIQVTVGQPAEVGNQCTDQLSPTHLSIDGNYSLIFPAQKLVQRWCALRVVDGQTVRERIDLKGRVTAATRLSLGQRTLVLVGNEEGGVGVLPQLAVGESTSQGATTAQGGDFTEVSITKVFDSGDLQHRTIVRFEMTSIPNIVACFSRTSAALLCLPDATSCRVLSRRISTTATEYSLQHLHLPRELSGNHNFVLLASECNGTNIQVFTFLRLSAITAIESAPTLPGASTSSTTSPPLSLRDSVPLPPVELPPSQQQQQQGGGLKSVFASIKAKFSKKPSGGTGQASSAALSVNVESFALQVTAETCLLTTLCEGYCRKSFTSVDDPHRLVTMDPRLHGIVVWLRLHHSDEVLLLRDEALHKSLLRLRREDL